jgi:hydroxymethylpyrimidine pyrophosphatase-like HAD family hydrolase
MQHQGWIALDIDGTITTEKTVVPPGVRQALGEWARQGWKLAFATGRPFAFAQKALHGFDFSYWFVGQNGSLALQMPGRDVLFRRYLAKSQLSAIEEQLVGTGVDFVVYAGIEKGDICYFRPSRFLREEEAYLRELQSRQEEPWVALQSFDEIPIGAFPLVKCFGKRAAMSVCAERMRRLGMFEVAHIRDPHATGVDLLLITDRQATKGRALASLFALYGRGERVIGAGDDENDLSLLEVADVKIAMPHAPEAVKQKANQIAFGGIVETIQKAVSGEC